MKKLTYLVGSIVTAVPWIYAIVQHLSNREWIMLLIDGFIPPIGFIDGIGMYLGYW